MPYENKKESYKYYIVFKHKVGIDHVSKDNKTHVYQERRNLAEFALYSLCINSGSPAVENHVRFL